MERNKGRDRRMDGEREREKRIQITVCVISLHLRAAGPLSRRTNEA